MLEALNERLPPSRPLLGALSRIDPFPTVTGPAPGVGAPTARVARRAGARAGGVVRVLGTACGLRVQGSGWIAAPGLVVTNAHVVAGQRDTAVQVRGRGPRLAARAVAFDARNDLALLRVEGATRAAVAPAAPGAPSGTAAAVLGFPRDGPYDVRPARLSATRHADPGRLRPRAGGADGHGGPQACGPATRAVPSWTRAAGWSPPSSPSAWAVASALACPTGSFAAPAPGRRAGRNGSLHALRGPTLGTPGRARSGPVGMVPPTRREGPI